MLIKKANLNDTNTVHSIVQTPGLIIYPHYYPKGAVEFFMGFHNQDNIKKEIREGKVFIGFNKKLLPVGTVTVDGNEVKRLFVLPEFHNEGFEGELLKFAESKIKQNFSTINLPASFPAKTFYLNRGYSDTTYHKIKTGNGDVLCYDMMKKHIN